MDYREDYIKIIHEARKSRKHIEYQKEDKKIYVLASGSIQYFGMVLEYFLRQNGISAQVIEGSYDAIRTEILDDNSPLYQIKPDILVVIPSYRDILAYPELLMEKTELEKLEESTIQECQRLWNKLKKIEHLSVFWGNYVLPYERQLSNLEYIPSSKNSFLQRINELMTERVPRNINIVDMEYLSSLIGKMNWFDYKDYYLHKNMFALTCLPLVANTFAKLIRTSMGQVKKCLVLDLDNTLWGGVVAETGYEGIELNENIPLGEAYHAFQQYIKGLSQRGVILAVCSKNDKEVALEPFEKNENMCLKLSDIAAFYANWEDKATNIQNIARELNIGIDSMVFFDDNPAERKLVSDYLPQVQVIDVPEDPAEYIQVLESASPFELLELTQEDLKRTDSYVQNQKRKLLEESSVDYDGYLRGLSMTGVCEEIKDTDIARYVQLINKSNQFNLRTQRYDREQIESFYKDKEIRLLKVELSDIFTKYGIISCIILKKQGTSCFIDTWVMSCRVLKREVEKFAFHKIILYAKEMGCTVIEGEYLRTAKNGMVKELLPSMGFEIMEQQQDKISYRLEIEKAQKSVVPIQEEEKK